MKVQLVVVQGKPEGMTIPLASPRYKIGRGENCQLRPNSDLVSREHAEFVLGPDSVIVQDLGSRNGTEVNGKKLAANQPQSLKSGDLIKVGTLTFAISIEGLATTKPMTVVGGGSTRKPSLDDVSGDEIDSWLVSDESRPTPDRPSGVYGGDTITLATYNGKDKGKPAAAEVKPAPAPKPPAPAAKPAPPAARPVPAPAPPPAPVPAPVVKAPEPAPVPAPPQPVAVAPVVPPPLPPVVAPPVVVAAQPEAETTGINPLFDFLPDNMPESDAEPETESESNEETVEDDGIEDLSALQDAEDGDEGDAADSVPEDFIDESNPFYVKKPEPAPAATKPGVGSQDSSSAAGDILRKLLDRRRSPK